MATPEEQAEWLQRITLDGYGERFIECADLIRSQQSKLGPLQTHYDNAPPDYVKRLVLRVEEEERKRKAAECRLEGAEKDSDNLLAECGRLKAERDDARARLHSLLFQPHAERDHMTSCDRIMGATHPCTCHADEYRGLLLRSESVVERQK